MSRTDAALATTGHYFDDSSYDITQGMLVKVMYLNREGTSDGEHKDNAAVGSGVYESDRLYIADGSYGLQFDDSSL